MELKNLRVVEIGHLDHIKRQLGLLSHHLEYRLTNSNSQRKLITDEEVFEKVRDIINLIQKV